MIRSWVIPYLRERGDPLISLEELEKDFLIPPFVYRRLAQCLAIICPRYYDRDRVYFLIGYVLAHVPEDIFRTLLGLNVTFICSDNVAGVSRIPGAAVLISLHGILDLSDTQAMGAITHEICHVAGGEVIGSLDATYDELEQRADTLAESWGFGGEISAIRTYFSRKEKNNGQK
jgi:hypothetical protein